MPADVLELLQQYETLKTQTLPWKASWSAIAETMMPAFTGDRPGDLRTRRIYDTTGLQGNILLAGHINSGVTNFQMRFFELRMSYKPLNEIKAVKVWLDDCAETIQDKLSATTTPQAFHEKYLQFSGMGTGALFADTMDAILPGSGQTGMLSRSLPIDTYYIAENTAGQVDTMYRELELTPRQAVQHFGADGVPEGTKLAEQKADLRHVPGLYVHAVYPRAAKGRDPSNENQANMAYTSCYVDVTAKEICHEGGYRWFPYMVSRWQKLRSWSPWGFGPGHIALPEVLTLNAMDRDILKALQFHFLPPWWSDDPDAAGRVVLLPGYINTITKGSTLTPMSPGGQFNISHMGMEDRRQRIRQAFYMDQLITLPTADASGKMTAYEVAQRVAYMSRLMGPAFMRLLGEFLNPYLDITFGTMLENDELPQPPDVVIEAAMQGFGKITVDYEGPLAKAQQGDEIQAMEGTLAMAERYYASTQDASVYDNFDMDELIRRAGKIYGIPASVLRDQAEVEQKRAQRAEEQQAAAEAEGLREDVKAVGAAAPMVKALTPAPQGAAA